MDKVIDFAFSVQGFNHIKEHKVCQDASLCFSDASMDIIAVADGHGSNDYPRTDRGARFAVAAAISSTRRFVETLFAESIDISDDSNQRLQQLSKSILSEWYSKVEEDLIEHPFAAEELEKVSEKYKARYSSGQKLQKAYGTTLIMACVTSRFWFGLQIGDGKCMVLDSKCNAQEPIPWDDSCQSNITTSICDSDAVNEFRFYFSKEMPFAIFMGSDGIDDSYPSQEEYHSLYRSIALLFGENCEVKARQEIQEYLPSLSRKGSGDDVTVAGILFSEVFQERTQELLKAINNHSKAAGEYNRKAKDVKLASERLEYVLTAINRAKAAYDAALDKEKDARDEIEKTKMAYEKAEQNLKVTGEILSEAQSAFFNTQKKDEVAMPSPDFSDNKVSSSVDSVINQTPSLTLES